MVLLDPEIVARRRIDGGRALDLNCEFDKIELAVDLTQFGDWCCSGEADLTGADVD